MINFRFHLISLIAVFLALALGVVMGYGVLGQPTVDTLQDRINTVEARADRIKGENDDLRAENGRMSDAIHSLDEFAVSLRLDSTTVVPVAARGVDEDKMVDSVRLARRANAGVPGVVWLEEKWNLADPDDVTELATIVDAPSTSRASVRDAAAKALASRLSSGRVTSGRTDLLQELVDANYVSLQTVDGEQFDASTFDGRNARHLLAGGTAAVVPAAQGTVALARALVALGQPVVVVDEWRETEGGPDRGAGLEAILGDEQLKGAVATVDAFDTTEGPLTAVLVLGERGQGVIGHYGFGTGAERPMPEWWVV